MTAIASEIQRLYKLAASNDWGEREEAGFALRDLIESDFQRALPLTKTWVKDKNERVRRAACLACMQRKAVTSPSRLRRVLARLRPLMADDSIYVRKCCGPFVVGYLGYTYPETTLPWLRKMSAHPDHNVRANVAKAFTQALGRRFPLEAMRILCALPVGGSHRVKSALLSALRNVEKTIQGAEAARRLRARISRS